MGIVKDIWKYVKDHNLQDPTNKRFFFPDKTLSKVFGTKKVFYFKISRVLESHFKALNPSEM
jgi:upstream activation factor subunit UAF30